MICISVTPESRRLAKADLLNASRQGDLIELCLDHLVKSPDIAALLDTVDKPILITCRRSQDGVKWTGDEEERLQLLRQAIVAEPDWIELDLDIASKVPRYGKTRRVVAYTSLYSPLGSTRAEIDEVFENAIGVDRFPVGGQAHQLVFARVDSETAVVGEGGVEQAQRMRVVHFLSLIHI